MTLFLLAVVGLADPAMASEVGARPFGLGIVLGDPTGLSGKLYLGGGQNAVDMALAFDTYGRYEDSVYVHATYLWHPSVLAAGADAEVPWHVGIGGYASSDQFDDRGDDESVGVRAPIGIDVNLNSVPLQFFGDVALRVGILPGTYIDFDIGLGARYFF